jgi:hypothetical protein
VPEVDVEIVSVAASRRHRTSGSAHDTQDDLAGVASPLRKAMGSCCLLEGQDGADLGTELARLDQAGDGQQTGIVGFDESEAS